MKRIRFMVAFLIAGLSLMLCGCGLGIPELFAGKSSDKRGGTKESMHMDDLWTVTEYIEKTTNDLRMPENCIRFMKEEPFVAYVDGNLFGREAEGTLNLNDEYKILSADLFTTKMSYDEMLELFTAMYGEPVARGENPNVEINGGIVTWHKFNTGKYIVTLSTASGYDYIVV